MAASIADRRAAFHRLHESGCFVIPNPWDAGSAVWLQQAGFKALASTSSGYAWTLALADNGVGLEGMLAHLKAIVAATEIPVNADFENAYADEPAGVAANVLRAAEAGVAGSPWRIRRGAATSRSMISTRPSPACRRPPGAR
jgi:PEP phosphonomutase and related enzymes